MQRFPTALDTKRHSHLRCAGSSFTLGLWAGYVTTPTLLAFSSVPYLRSLPALPRLLLSCPTLRVANASTSSLKHVPVAISRYNVLDHITIENDALTGPRPPLFP